VFFVLLVEFCQLGKIKAAAVVLAHPDKLYVNAKV